MKQRRNLTIDNAVWAMLTQISRNSTKVFNRHMSRSEIVENLVRKQFLDKKDQLQKQISRLTRELEEANAEFYAIAQREKYKAAGFDVEA